MAADVSKQVLCLQFSATTTSGSTPIFLGGVQKIKLRTLTNDVYVDFDQPVAPTTSYRVAASNTADTEIDVDKGLIKNLYIQAVTGTSTVYIISIVG